MSRPQPGRRQPRALVVDYGGVLTGPIRDTFEAWFAADEIAPADFIALLDEWRPTQDNPIHQLETGVIGGDAFADQVVARLRRADGAPLSPDDLNARIFAAMHVDDDALTMLQAARQAGLKTALLSNSWDFPYPWEQLDPLLDVKIVSGEVGLRKPDPAIYRLAAAELSVALDECVFVDDIEVNIQAAQTLGMVAVHHTDLPSTLAALADAVPALASYLPDLPAVSEPWVPKADSGSDTSLTTPATGG